MNRFRLVACLFAALLLAGCASDEDGRIRQGIQDPIERHPHHRWHFPRLVPDDISVTSLPDHSRTA